MKKIAWKQIVRNSTWILAAAFSVFMSAIALNPPYVWVMSIITLLISGIITLLTYIRFPSRWGIAQKPESNRAGHQTLLVMALGCLIVVSIVVFQWPLRITFALAKPQMEYISHAMPAKGKLTKQEAGIFSMPFAERDDGLAVLSLSEETDMGEPCLFVRGNPQHIKKVYRNYDIIVLNNGWCFASSL